MKTIKKNKRHFIVPILAVIFLAAGGYFLLLTLAPQTQIINQTPGESWNRPVEPPKVGANRLYIPRISLNIDYQSGGPEVLDEQAWWRYPERGDPVKGGNFILSAHRFELAPTPAQTIRKSPFYHLGRVELGDRVFVDYEGKRYEYRIEKKFEVTPTQIEIEEPSDEHKLTIYTCLLEGSEAGRDVLIAKQTRKNVDPAEPLAH